MPMPTPRKGETEKNFVSRCMADATMLADYPENEQRAAVCYTQWRDAKASASFAIGKRDMVIRGMTGAKFVCVASARQEDGALVQRFRKDVMRVGEFYKESEDVEYVITAELLNHWVGTFHQMREAGIKIPMPYTHDDTGDPRDNAGWVVDMFVDGDVLVAVCDVSGREAIDTVLRSDVSVGSPASFTDPETKNVYEQPIEHVALVTNPLVTRLGDWIPIAASRKERVMEWKTIGKALGIEEELTNDNAETLLVAYAETRKAETDKLRSEVEELKASRKSDPPSKDDTTVPASPAVVRVVARARQAALDGLVQASRITPDVAKKLAARYIGDESQAVALELSRGGDGSDFDALCDMLMENDPVTLKEQSGPQTMELSRTGKTDDGVSPLIADAERRAKEAAARR